MAESFADLVTEGESLADSQRYTEAIAVLTEANRLRRTAEVERRLVQLRRAAFDAIEPGSPARDWPPTTADPFPGVDGLPEISRDELSADLIGGGIAHHGALVVRGLVPPHQVAPLVDGMDASLAASEAWHATAGSEPIGTVPDRHPDADPDPDGWFSPADRAMDGRRERLRLSGALFAADAPRVLFELFEFLQESGLPSILAEHFGEPATLSLNKFTLRRVAPDAGPTSWHQDGAFLGAEVRALNLWISLTPCGGPIDDTPGLAVVPRRIDQILETGNAGTMHGIGNTLVRERYGDEVIRPFVDAGDAMFFDERFLHKTGRRRGMTRPRHAIEWWFFPRSSFPQQYPGLVV